MGGTLGLRTRGSLSMAAGARGRLLSCSGLPISLSCVQGAVVGRSLLLWEPPQALINPPVAAWCCECCSGSNWGLTPCLRSLQFSLFKENAQSFRDRYQKQHQSSCGHLPQHRALPQPLPLSPVSAWTWTGPGAEGALPRIP